MTELCHTVQGVHIPGCWPCVIYGGDYPPRYHATDRCYCRVSRAAATRETDPDAAMKRRIAKLEEQVKVLAAALEARA